MPEYADIATYHPLFLYESMYNLLIVLCLWRIDHSEKIRLREGSLFLCYLIAYPTGRFFLEFLRLDTALVGKINMNQLIMAVTAVISLILLIIRERSAEEK